MISSIFVTENKYSFLDSDDDDDFENYDEKESLYSSSSSVSSYGAVDRIWDAAEERPNPSSSLLPGNGDRIWDATEVDESERPNPSSSLLPGNGKARKRRRMHSVCVSYALIGLLVIFFLFLCVKDGGVEDISMNPLFGPSRATLAELYAIDAGSLETSPWQLILAIFYCAGVIELVIVVLFLLIWIREIERRLNPARMAFILLVSGTTGSLVSAFLLPHQVATSAAPAVAGMLGSGLAELAVFHGYFRRPTRAGISIAFQLFVLFSLSLFPFASSPLAVFSGLSSGTFCTLFLILAKRNRNRFIGSYAPRLICSVISLFVAVIPLVFIPLALFFFHLRPDCSLCETISCIPYGTWCDQ